MEKIKRKSVNDNLKKYTCNESDRDGFIEVTEWSNGEGYDIVICSGFEQKQYSLSIDELSAINYLSKVLEYEIKD